MGDGKKPRICEVLEVEVNQEWTLDLPGYEGIINRISQNGYREWKSGSRDWELAGWEKMFSDAIKHPEKIRLVSHWTEEDIADAKAVRQLWPNATHVKMDAGKNLVVYKDSGSGGGILARIAPAAFPTLKQYESATLDDILEAENDA